MAVPGIFYKTIDIPHKSADKMWEILLILSSVLLIELLDVKMKFGFEILKCLFTNNPNEIFFEKVQ